MSCIVTDDSNFLIRNATHDDFNLIKNLLNSSLTKFFGPTKRRCNDSFYFFKTYASHRMLVFETRAFNILIGYAEFTNYPQIEALPKECWMDWYRHHYCTQLPVNTTNTLFFTYFVCNKRYMPDMMQAVLAECFNREQKLRYIVSVEMPYQEYKIPQDVPHYYLLQQYSEIFYPREFSVKRCSNVQKLHIISRYTIIKHMRSRKALPEDNDDLVEIIDNDRPEMRKELGDFFIAEELLREDKEGHHNMIIVTETDNVTTGFQWLNDNVDLLRLAENFELESFDNLMKFSQHRRQSKRETVLQTLVRKPSHMLFSPVNIMKEITQQNCCYGPIKSGPSSSSANSNNSTSDSSADGSTERFFMRQGFFKKCQTIQYLLTSLCHYVRKQEKTMHFTYNVNSEGDDEPLDESCNAFAMQLMGLHETIDIRRTFRFLAIAFSAFPNTDYCLLSTAADMKLTNSLNEILKYFIPVEPRVTCEIEDHLYITHRSAIYGDISLHRLRPEDVPEIDDMLQYNIRSSMRPDNRKDSLQSASDNSVANMSRAEFEAQEVHRIMNKVFNDPFCDYTFMTIRVGSASMSIDENVLVGYVVVRSLKQIDFLLWHYIVPHYHNDLSMSCAEVVTFRLHPFFHFRSDTLFREVARFTDYWDFYYIMTVRSHENSLANDLMKNMQPIEPQRTKKFMVPPWNDGNTNIGEDGRDYGHGNFAVFRNNLCPTRFFGNTTTIVIIGFSDVCKAFLRLMAFGWNSADLQNSKMHCCVPRLKISVITPPGVVEAEYDSYFHCRVCKDDKDCWINFQNSSAFIRDTVKRMDLRIWVDFVAGNLKEIDRINQQVVLDTNCNLYYETLLLMCDNKFGVPKQLHPDDELPPNYAQINTRLDKLIFYYKLEAMMQETNDQNKLQILVYGAYLSTFEFINFLLVHNVSASCVTLVKPYRLEEAVLFQNINNPYADGNIEVILHEMLEDLGVTVHERVLFSHWERYSDDDNISSVVFDNRYGDETLTIECDLFISFYENSMDPKIGRVLRLADVSIRSNKILVDEEYHTNDRNIFAFGKYIQHIEEPNHQYRYVSPMEAAEKLIHILQLGMTELPDSENTIKFLKPSYFQVQLPMNFKMVKIIQPKRYLANHLGRSPAMSTYCDGDFCRVGLNEHGVVEQIVVITRKEIYFDFLQYFIGKHEALLNNLRSNCYLNQIDNFLNFFQQSWTELIMHNHLDELQTEIRHLVHDAAESLMNLSIERNDRKEKLKRCLLDLGTTKQVEGAFLDFLRKYRDDFQQPFALPEDFS